MVDFFRKMLDFVFPLKCVFCGVKLKSGTMPAVCCACNVNTQRLGAKCPKCGAIPSINETGELHCLTCKVAGRYYDVAFSIYKYSGNVRNSILRYKFYSGVDMAKTLSYELARFVVQLGFNGENIDFIVYVPPDKKRLKQRGYDHVRLIAEEISNYSKIPILKNSLQKKLQTKAQSLMSRKGRALNVKGVYALSTGIDLKSKKVLLIDDVLTTGSTVNEVSRVLKRAGIAYVAVFTIAYTAR